MDLESNRGFDEDAFIGRSLRIGSKAVLLILERDPPCKMTTLDPDTAAVNPEILCKVAMAHKGMAAVYRAVLVEGTVRTGDPIEVLS